MNFSSQVSPTNNNQEKIKTRRQLATSKLLESWLRSWKAKVSTLRSLSVRLWSHPTRARI